MFYRRVLLVTAGSIMRCEKRVPGFDENHGMPAMTTVTPATIGDIWIEEKVLK